MNKNKQLKQSNFIMCTFFFFRMPPNPIRQTVIPHPYIFIWRWGITVCTFRDLKSIDVSRFRQMLSSSSLFIAPADSADDYAMQIENVGHDIIDQLVPLKTDSRIKHKKPHVWLSDEAVAAKRHRRRLERKWKAGGGEKERWEYRAQCKKANSLITKSLQDHNRDKIKEAENNPKAKCRESINFSIQQRTILIPPSLIRGRLLTFHSESA